jgi:hypothetical protein
VAPVRAELSSGSEDATPSSSSPAAPPATKAPLYRFSG